MQRFINWFAWLIVALVLVVAAVNLPTLMIAAPINLLAWSVNLPLGLVLIGVSAVFVLLFFLATLHNQVSALRESNRLSKEIQRLQGIVEQSQTTALAALRGEMKEEFGALHHRFDLLPEVSKTLSQPPETHPLAANVDHSAPADRI